MASRENMSVRPALSCRLGVGAALFFLERYQQAQQTQYAAYITALEGTDLWSIAQSNIWQIKRLRVLNVRKK
jgi:hypothetical protein